MQTDQKAQLTGFVEEIARFMQIPCEVSVSAEESGSFRVAVQSDDNGRLLIGKNGQNLKALEHVVRMMWLRRYPNCGTVAVDVNGYRAEKTQELVKSVHAAAVRVQQTRRSEALEPMTSYERRVVHTELAAYSDLATESVGQDPYRRVVIKPL